ncbi:MAG TPA: hypothetical protein VGH80_13060 [Xanthomonadaceae bacterium]|jgi:hypothetical protein
MAEAADPSPNPSSRRRDWDGAAAVIAAFVGLLALAVSAYTAQVQREQVRAQVWTRLFFANSDVDRTLMVMNKGVGPASIQSVRIYVDGKAQPDWAHVYAALGLPMPEQRVDSTLNGIVVAANERINYLQFAHADDWAAFKSRAGRVKLRACYCSVLDECLVFDERAAHSGHGAVSSQVTPAAKCDRVEADEFND